MGNPYLFRFSGWHKDQPEYILVYAENEEEARIIASKQFKYNCGKKAELKDIISCTIYKNNLVS